MRNFLISVSAIVRIILLVALVFVPLLIIKGALKALIGALPKMPEDKPKWIDAVAYRLGQFYEDYLKF